MLRFQPWTRGAPCPCCGPSRALSEPPLARAFIEKTRTPGGGAVQGWHRASRSALRHTGNRGCSSRPRRCVLPSRVFLLPPSESSEAPDVPHSGTEVGSPGRPGGRRGPGLAAAASPPGCQAGPRNADSQKRGHSAGSVGAAVRGRTPSPRAAGRAPCEGPDGCPAPRLSRSWPCATQLGPSD
jgi:hypothetical protein